MSRPGDVVEPPLNPGRPSQSRNASKSGVVAPNDRTSWANLPFSLTTRTHTTSSA